MLFLFSAGKQERTVELSVKWHFEITLIRKTAQQYMRELRVS